MKNKAIETYGRSDQISLILMDTAEERWLRVEGPRKKIDDAAAFLNNEVDLFKNK